MRAVVQGHPTVPCEICTKATPMLGTKRGDPCWELEQRVKYYATRLLRDAKAAPQVRALLEKALETKLEPPEAA